MCLKFIVGEEASDFSSFQIYAYAITPDNYVLEHPLHLLFKVEDDNDNAPYFENVKSIFNIPENCRSGKFTFTVLQSEDALKIH